MLVFSGTSENEADVALGVDIYINFNGSVWCVCHTSRPKVQDVVNSRECSAALLSRILQITTFVDNHAAIRPKIVRIQCEEFTCGTIINLSKECPKRWHPKLIVLEKYVTLKLVLERVFGESAPNLLETGDEDFIIRVIIIYAASATCG